LLLKVGWYSGLFDLGYICAISVYLKLQNITN
jgi:hypothetical protein